MSVAAERRLSRQLPVILTQGFRPFFLAAAVWAAVALALWVGMLTGSIAVPSRLDPLAWHVHEMLFGFVMAAIAGFLLTAIPNWTSRPPVGGVTLALLAGLWLLGRFDCLVSAHMPAWLAVAADLVFPATLAIVVAREIVAGRSWRNLPMVMPVTALGMADLLMHLEAEGYGVPAAIGWRLALAVVAILMSVIGGRIIPSFTRNWLARRGAAALPASHGAVDVAALFALHAGLLGWVVAPQFPPAGALLIAAAALNLWRLSRWRGGATLAEPLLAILHVGYGWLAIGVGLLGASLLTAAVPPAAGVHALTAGAIGTLTLAVMTRATRGHTGRELVADGATCLIYGLVTLAAVSRVAAAFSGDWALPLLLTSGGCWIAAFALFVLYYGPMLLSRRVSSLTT